MEAKTLISTNRIFIILGALAGVFLGLIYGLLEYSLSDRSFIGLIILGLSAGLHGSKVLITWIGEVKKEIVYVGDLLNTAARIAEECKKAKQDFLLSGDVFNQLDGDTKNNCLFYDQLQLRGKQD